MSGFIYHDNLDVTCYDLFTLESIETVAHACSILSNSYAASFSYNKKTKTCFFKTILNDFDRLPKNHNEDFITVLKLIENYKYYPGDGITIIYNLDIQCNDLFKIIDISLHDAITGLKQKPADAMSYDFNTRIAYYKLNHDFINVNNADKCFFDKEHWKHEIKDNFITIMWNSFTDVTGVTDVTDVTDVTGNKEQVITPEQVITMPPEQIIKVTSLNFMQIARNLIDKKITFISGYTCLLFNNVEEAKFISKYLYPLFPKGIKLVLLVDPNSSDDMQWITRKLNYIL
jgi:hypothetical protein